MTNKEKDDDQMEDETPFEKRAREWEQMLHEAQIRAAWREVTNHLTEEE